MSITYLAIAPLVDGEIATSYGKGNVQRNAEFASDEPTVTITSDAADDGRIRKAIGVDGVQK